jgi:hypothetical protein
VNERPYLPAVFGSVKKCFIKINFSSEELHSKYTEKLRSFEVVDTAFAFIQYRVTYLSFQGRYNVSSVV